MKVLNCLIIEDEPIATEILTDYIQQVAFLNLVGNCTSAIEAIAPIRKGLADVLFLDLHLPGIKGFDFLRSLAKPPQVIVVSAYHQYALEGYELNIVDYLLKPVTFTRFLKAVQKLPASSVTKASSNLSEERETPLYFSENRKQVRVLPSEIIFLESQKDYVQLHTLTRTVTTKSTLQRIYEQLPVNEFLRIHRSFVVALSKIVAFSQSEIELPTQTLPIGRNYKAQVQEVLKRHLKR